MRTKTKHTLKAADFATKRRAMEKEVAGFLARLEKWCVENNVDPHTPERSKRARAVAYAQITDLCDHMAEGGLHTLVSRQEAHRWIDACLAAGISFDRFANVNPKTGEVTISFAMRLADFSGSHAIAQAFIQARAYGPKLVDDVLAERFGAKSNEAHMGKMLNLDGDFRQSVHFHTLRETATELRVARLGERVEGLRESLYGSRS